MSYFKLLSLGTDRAAVVHYLGKKGKNVSATRLLKTPEENTVALNDNLAVTGGNKVSQRSYKK